jgi:hypothetical protein
MRWSRGIQGTYTDRPQHARLAVSSDRFGFFMKVWI